MAASSTKVPAPVLSKLPVPDTMPVSVNCAPSTSIALLPEITNGLVTLLLPVLVDSVPPFTVMGTVTPVTLRKSNVPPAFTVVAPEVAPKAEASVMAIVPPLMLVAPV